MATVGSARMEAVLSQAITTEIARRVEEQVAEELARAKERIERNVRDQVGQIVANVANHYTFERAGQDIVIRVRFEGGR